jgi:hypothetical protein
VDAFGTDFQGDVNPVVYYQHGVLEGMDAVQHLGGKPSESAIIDCFVPQLDHSRACIEKLPAKREAVGEAVDPAVVEKKNVFGMAHCSGLERLKRKSQRKK